MAKSRNAAALDDFVKFCNAHPDLRFWQALSTWTKSAVFVLRSGSPSELAHHLEAHPRFDLRDTFPWEGKDG